MPSRYIRYEWVVYQIWQWQTIAVKKDFCAQTARETVKNILFNTIYRGLCKNNSI